MKDVHDVPDIDDFDDSFSPLFPGDRGVLDEGGRRALTGLLQKRFISVRTDPKAWEGLVAHRDEIESRLNELYLGLDFREQSACAHAYQLAPELPAIPYRLKSTNAMIGPHVRLFGYLAEMFYLARPSKAGERVPVSRSEVHDALIDTFKTGSDLTKAENSFLKAWSAIEASGYLWRERNAWFLTEAFEFLDFEAVQAINDELQRMLRER